MIRDPATPEYHVLPSQTKNPPERSPGSLVGDNPSGWAFGRMGQIHMERANRLRTLAAGLAADKFLLIREAVDERRCRDEVGLGTLAKSAAPYRRTRNARGAARAAHGGMGRQRPASRGGAAVAAAGGSPPSPAPPSSTAASRSLPGSPSSGSCHNVPVECAAELCGVTHKMAFEWRRRVLATVSGQRDRIVLRDTVWGERDLRQRHRPLQGLRAGPQVRPVPPEAGHLRRHRRPQEPRCGRLRPREAQLGAREEGHGRQDSARVAAHPRPRAGPRHAGQGERSREQGAQGPRERPGQPGPDGDGERPVLLSEALPVALLGDAAAEPLGVSRLVRLLFRVNRAHDRRNPTIKVVRHILMTDATYRSLG